MTIHVAIMEKNIISGHITFFWMLYVGMDADNHTHIHIQYSNSPKQNRLEKSIIIP
jgi:hypothetical protein